LVLPGNSLASVLKKGADRLGISIFLAEFAV
jgi:hypothetical protein